MLVQRSAYATSQKFHSTYFQPNFSPLFPDLILPDLVVFDLDMCMWQPEMYTLYEIPTEKSEKTLSPLLPGNGDSKGVIGVRSGDEIIRLFPAALKILQDFYFDKYPGMKIAVASSADTPLAVKIGRSAMNYLEVVPGVSMRSGKILFFKLIIIIPW
jgi:magnesium-dependent phosphatase 1